MKLKKIKILGFKSFADKVELVFDEEITAVVGPNGCGKSNIADAFRWVMGEQSAKSMRGGNMQDVIFAGTSKRKPLNLVEVTLTFENNLGRVDIPYREVEVSRRYHRNGDSEYLINGNPVRLKDVQALLIDVGIGKNAYSIFEQGKIDQVIQLGPEERRVIFESAAGISRFLMNERETNRKLDDVNLNMKRLEDIRKEVSGQIDQLQKQAEKATRYKKLTEQLRQAEIKLLSNKIANAQERKLSLEETLSQQDEKKVEQEEALNEFKNSFKAKKDKNSLKEIELKEAEKKYFEIKSVYEVRQKELESILERIEETLNLLKKRKTELADVVKTRQERNQEIKEKLSVEDQVKKAVDDIREAFEAQEKVYKEIDKQAQAKRDELIDLHNKCLKKIKESSDTQSQYKQLETKKEYLKEKSEEARQNELRLKNEVEKLTSEESLRFKELEQFSVEIEKDRADFAKIDQEIKTHQETTDSLEILHGNLRKDLINLQAKEKTLSKLKEEMEGFSSGSKAIIKAFPELKKLYEYFKVASGFEEAVAGCLKQYGDTLVAGTEELFNKVLSYAKEKKITDFSLIALPTESPKFLSSLKEKIEPNAIASHFLNQKGIVKDLEEAFSKPSSFEEIYTLDGFYIDRLKVVFRGSNQGQNLFLREAELKNTLQSIQAINKDFSRVENDLKESHKKKEQLWQTRRDLDKKVREKEMRLVEKNFHYQKMKGDIEKVKMLLQTQTGRLKEDEEVMKRLEVEIASQAKLLATAEKERDELLDRKTLIEQEMKKVQAHLEKEKALLQTRTQEYNQCQDEARKNAHVLKVLEVKNQEAASLEKKWEEEIQTLIQTEKDLALKEKDLRVHIAKTEELVQKREKEVEEVSKCYNQSKKEIESEEKKVEAEEIKLKKLSDELHNRGMQFNQIETQEASLCALFSEQFPDEKISPDKTPIEKLEKEIRSCKSELTQFSDVNLAACDTLDQHEKRLETLTSDLEDLEKAGLDLNSIIEKLREESRTLFFTTFEQIRANFKKNFAILFSGGEADLELTSKEDLLKAGVEIHAKPPGKQMRSINLLSGGEKCLTALALLFAIFEVKAAPFCILDEIDAPLDDTNVGRFTEMVKHFREKCQFIIITHNKRTMSMADKLYGVSMEEKGVSKILMMEFEKKEVQLV